MAGWKKHDPWKGSGIKPGEVSMTGDTVDNVQPEDTGNNQFYPGYMPQRYISPKMGPQKHNAGEVGDGTVPNNTDRGNYGHGVIVDSEVWDKDHSRKDASDGVPQVMPEEEDQREYDPVKVTIVDKSPDELTVMSVSTYIVTMPSSSTGGGQPTQSGLTPIRILGKNPRRTRAIVAISNMQGGSIPVLLTQEQSNPAYGFPIASATTFPLVLYTTDAAWVMGSTMADSFTVCVIEESAKNSDPYYPV
jgi:hypothetical protein